MKKANEYKKAFYISIFCIIAMNIFFCYIGFTFSNIIEDVLNSADELSKIYIVKDEITKQLDCKGIEQYYIIYKKENLTNREQFYYLFNNFRRRFNYNHSKKYNFFQNPLTFMKNNFTGDCKSFSLFTKCLAEYFGYETNLCFANNHTFTLAYIGSKIEVLDQITIYDTHKNDIRKIYLNPDKVCV